MKTTKLSGNYDNETHSNQVTFYAARTFKKIDMLTIFTPFWPPYYLGLTFFSMHLFIIHDKLINENASCILYKCKNNDYISFEKYFPPLKKVNVFFRFITFVPQRNLILRCVEETTFLHTEHWGKRDNENSATDTNFRK